MVVRPLPCYGAGKGRSRRSREKRLRPEVGIGLVASHYAFIFELGSVKETTFVVIDPCESSNLPDPVHQALASLGFSSSLLTDNDHRYACDDDPPQRHSFVRAPVWLLPREIEL